jgi:hypothetical protein
MSPRHASPSRRSTPPGTASRIKARSGDNYVAVEKGMMEIERALMPEKPDPAKVTALVNEVLAKYNASLAEVVKEARSRP